MDNLDGEVIIEVEGGVITRIMSPYEELTFVVVDHDSGEVEYFSWPETQFDDVEAEEVVERYTKYEE
jgi:hypothetical protein